MSDLNIYQRINAIMADITYIKRGSAGQGTGVLYDEVIADLQPLLIKHGVVVTVDFLADSSRANAKGNYIYEGFFDVHYVNIDNPSDKFTSKVVAHAMDSGDKAPGKAITYASKIAHLKTFGYETGDNDESRADLANTDIITAEQSAELFNLLCDPETNCYTQKGQRIATAFKFTNINEIPAKKFSQILAKAKS